MTMTTELTMLAWTAALCAVLWVPYTLQAIATRGLVRVMGYPKPDDKKLPDWAARAYRAHMNLIENIGPFAALVLVAQLSTSTNATTASAVTIFFWARVVQAAVHYLGIPYVRTLAFFVSFFAEIAIFLAIIGMA